MKYLNLIVFCIIIYFLWFFNITFAEDSTGTITRDWLCWNNKTCIFDAFKWNFITNSFESYTSPINPYDPNKSNSPSPWNWDVKSIVSISSQYYCSTFAFLCYITNTYYWLFYVLHSNWTLSKVYNPIGCEYGLGYSNCHKNVTFTQPVVNNWYIPNSLDMILSQDSSKLYSLSSSKWIIQLVETPNLWFIKQNSTDIYQSNIKCNFSGISETMVQWGQNIMIPLYNQKEYIVGDPNNCSSFTAKSYIWQDVVFPVKAIQATTLTF